MTKENTNRLVLQRVIQWLDENGKSNTKIRRVVDMVLNHDADYGRAVYVANKEEQDLFKTTACPDCNGTGEIEDDEWTFCNVCMDYFLNDEKCECEE
jgi:hypothetical protein